MSHLPIQHKNETTPGKAVSWLCTMYCTVYYYEFINGSFAFSPG